MSVAWHASPHVPLPVCASTRSRLVAFSPGGSPVALSGGDGSVAQRILRFTKTPRWMESGCRAVALAARKPSRVSSPERWAASSSTCLNSFANSPSTP
ncbi:hypothetical protein BE11_45255 [Sorangium cellulosum]|nr:hypothetical protein BE11_45255 [Sorangium cellulosum]